MSSQPADAELARAAGAIRARQFKQAYAILQPRLAARRDDAAALALMAELAVAMDRTRDAVGMLLRVTELAPKVETNWTALADALHLLPAADALAAIAAQAARHPRVAAYRNLHAAMLDRAGWPEEALALFDALVDEGVATAGLHVVRGHLLKSLGRSDAAADAYHHAIAIDPARGEAWWGLSELKLRRFLPDEIAAMEAQLARPDLPGRERVFLDFALGAEREAEGDHAAAFAHYLAGNRRHRATIRHDPEALDRSREAAARLFTPDFFAERADWGCPAPDPIFVVGLPRSGSTLVEQILASHPAIEATRELGDLPTLVREVAVRPGGCPAALAGLSRDAVAALGETYLERTRVHRRTDRPLFVDKLPGNFQHVGLIRLILPNAKIIDVRREAMASGVSIFRQFLMIGHSFASDLAEIGRYRLGYEAMMRLWDAVLPGHVHRLDYEALVGDLEGEVRRLLDHLGLPFDPACLRFHETERAIRTPSAAQVRRPLDAGAAQAWRAFEPWLDPLRRALGSA
jgi:tetratricopeptide (TPR) repeat protein